MSSLLQEIKPVNIEDELKSSYLDYAMSVIVGRALPDVRDGLKPVHRRVLYAMHALGNEWNKGYKKSARVVGDVIGKYHPHGDTAVYDALVRMAQPFSLRYVLIDGQGNFGSVDGDPPAAMRYTEVRMAKIAASLLADIDKETVDFVPNYDDTEFQPEVLPSRVPNLIVNGASGIAVGMATNIPTHNLGEVIDACLALIDNSAITIDALMQHIPGPDFPTAGIINGRSGIVEAYRTGRGRIYLRSRTEVEVDKKSGRQSIIVTEIPYQVNKARLIEKIADLVKDKKVEGISALRDESDKDGMRIVIELKRGEVAEVILNQLYSQTQLETVFGINLVALDNNQPKVLNLKQILEAFIKHRREIVARRTEYELKKARERAHILEGLGIALVNIDAIIALIKAAKSPQEAKQQLLANTWPAGDIAKLLSEDPGATKLNNGEYQLSPTQAQAILDLRLHRLTGLEQDKIIAEYKNLLLKIAEYLEILSNDSKLMQVIRDELVAIKAEFADPRRTEIIGAQKDLSLLDLISEEDRVVTLSHGGYVKAQPLSDYKAQRRGGRGKSATQVKEQDYVSSLLIASSHDTLLCFSSLGKVYWLKVHQLPVAARNSRGRPIVNLLPLQENERISAILSLREYSSEQMVFMATRSGMVKQVVLSEFARPRASGIIAIDLEADDRLVGARLCTKDSEVLLVASSGKSIRFAAMGVRCMGRAAKGVRGIKLGDGQSLISLIVLEDAQNNAILLATRNGFGKRTQISEFPIIGRGAQGVIGIQASERNGQVVAAVEVSPNDDILMISDQGSMVRTKVSEISMVGRNTQGVRLISLVEGEHLVAVQRVEESELED